MVDCWIHWMKHLHSTQWSVTAKIYWAFFSSCRDKLKCENFQVWSFVLRSTTPPRIGALLVAPFADLVLIHWWSVVMQVLMENWVSTITCEATWQKEAGENAKSWDSDLPAFEARHEWKTYDKYVYIYMCIIWKYLENLLNGREFGKFLLEDST